jgi:signal transduction histidine kinase
MNRKIFEILNRKLKYLYCFVNKKYEIIFLEESPLKEFLHIQNGVPERPDIFNVFPEFFGLEKELNNLFLGDLNEIKIPKVNKIFDNKSYVCNIYLFASESMKDWDAVLFIEDITEEAELTRLIQQSRNENELLRKEIQNKNTDLKNAYKLLEEQNTELKKLVQMKDDFLAIASHDLRSPFNAILGFSNLLLEDEDLQPSHKESVEIIQYSANIQLDYINDILNILTLESGKIKLNKYTFSIKSVLDNSIKMLGILAKKKNITITTNVDNDFELELDFEKISQVLNNLIGNAIKFTPSGGNIEVSVIKNSLNQVEFHVKDSGIGISRDVIPSLFSKYTKTHKSGTEGEAGTGLGLAICKNLINLHGGNIFVESTQGKGSDFYFYLPI